MSDYKTNVSEKDYNTYFEVGLLKQRTASQAAWALSRYTKEVLHVLSRSELDYLQLILCEEMRERAENGKDKSCEE